MNLKVIFAFLVSYTLIRTFVVSLFNIRNSSAQLLTLGGASSEPPESQDTGTCLLISIRLRSSCWAFSSARIVLHKRRWKTLLNNNIISLYESSSLRPLLQSRKVIELFSTNVNVRYFPLKLCFYSYKWEWGQEEDISIPFMQLIERWSHSFITDESV